MTLGIIQARCFIAASSRESLPALALALALAPALALALALALLHRDSPTPSVAPPPVHDTGDRPSQPRTVCEA
jgi:hypothetical protein